MDSRYLSADASASIPSPDDALAQGFPTEGNTDLGVLATRIGAWWFYQVGEEIRNCIIAAGITPDKTKVNQLAQAIRILCDIPFASTSVFGKVKLSNNVNDTAQNTAPTSFALSQTWAEATRDASLSAKGRVKLVNSVSSTSTSEAATPNSVKVAYDKGVDAYNLAASHNAHLVPVGAVAMFLRGCNPSGWLPLNGQTITRSQFPVLFSAMGWGESYTLPNMDGRFPEGKQTYAGGGIYRSAGLPNITASFGREALASGAIFNGRATGAMYDQSAGGMHLAVSPWAPANNGNERTYFDASRSSSVYGNSNTVQPNSVTFVFYIKVI
jgi:microcystin-dependent protein